MLKGCDDVDWIQLDHERFVVVGSCEHFNELVSSIKRGQMLEQLHNYHIFKKTVT